MRIVCIGDTHLGPGPRNVDKRAAIDQILREQIETRVFAWIWLGDVNHARMTIDDRNWLAERLQQMAERAPVVIVRGNHDQDRELDIFARLKAPFPIHVINEPTVLALGSQYMPGVFSREAVSGVRTPLAVAVLPYPFRGGLVSAGASTEQVLDDGRHALAVICAEMGQQLTDARVRGLPTLMVGHLNVGGSIASTGQPQIGREIELDPASLAAFGDCPKVLGHIHKAQAVGGAVYAGSVSPGDWGEVEIKRYLVVDYALDGQPPVLTSIPLASRPLFHVEGTLTREGFEGQVLNGPGGLPQPAPTTWAGCDVRVRYRFAASERDILDPEVVRAGFREAHTLQLDPVAVPDRALRAPAVARATTLAAKLEAWAEANGEGVDATVLDRLALLDGSDRDHVLAALRARLAALEPAADAALAEAVPCEA